MYALEKTRLEFASSIRFPRWIWMHHVPSVKSISYIDLSSSLPRFTKRKTKSRRIAPRKCFLPSLKHRDTDLKIHTNSSITEKTVNEINDNVERKNHLNRSNKILISKKNTTNSSRKSKKQDKSVNRSINLNSSDHFEDSYLDSLQQRHLREKELVDKLIRQAITS